MGNGNRPTPEFRREAVRLALTSGLSPPNGHQQSLQGEVRGHAGLRRPTDHAAREQVDDDTQV